MIQPSATPLCPFVFLILPTSARVDWIIFCYCFAPPRIQPPSPSIPVIFDNDVLSEIYLIGILIDETRIWLPCVSG